MTNEFKDKFANRIFEHKAESEIIREGLWNEGPSLIRALQDRGGFGRVTLGELSRESGYSKAYLCRILNGQLIISPGAYLKLTELLERGAQ